MFGMKKKELGILSLVSLFCGKNEQNRQKRFSLCFGQSLPNNCSVAADSIEVLAVCQFSLILNMLNGSVHERKL